MARDYYDESKPKKKKKETPKPQKVTKSPSVTKVNNKASNSTFLGGGADVKKAEQNYSKSTSVKKTTSTPKRTTSGMTDAQYQKTYGEPRRATAQRTSTAKPEPVRRTTNHRLTAAQTQKMYGTTNPKLQTAEESRREREERRKEREERRLAAQRQKSGLNDQPTAAQKAATDRAIKNTPGLIKKAGLDAASGYGQTLTDVIARTASSERGTEAKAMKMGIEKGTKQYQELEEERKRTAEEARKDNQSLYQKMQQRQAEWDEKTKDAKGLEKAYYGAVESGTGMLADTAIGLLTGTGQVGALASMGMRTYGSSANQARSEGATETEAAVYGLLQAGKEMGTEMIGGGGLAKMAYGKGALGLGDIAANTLIRNLKGQKADLAHMGVRLLGDVAEENIEEFAGWSLDPLIKEFTYGRNTRERNARGAMQERSDALRAEIQNEDDARAAAAYLSSGDFFEQTVNAYREAGLSKKDAEEVADRMRDYLTASLTGDTDYMEQIENEVSRKVAGSHNVLKDYSFRELKETFEATTLLVGATGLPGNISTMNRGNLVKEQLGAEGVNALASTAIDFEDSQMSTKAKTMKARLDEGKDLTGTQVYELQAGMQEQVRKDTEREQSSRRMAARAIESDNLLTPYRQNQNGGIDLDEATEATYREHANRAGDIIDAIANENKESITDTQKVDGSKAIAGFQTGVFTVDDANALNYSNTAIRSAFEEATGVDLGQYIVRKKNGEVDIPATNTKTKDALFAMAADNLVKSAQAETANWMDNAKGQVVTQVSARMGASGSAVLQQALDDVDERDRSKYMMTANATDMLYQAARNMGTEWESIAPEATRMFPGISESKLKMMYEAGLADREMANDKARGRQVRMGQALSEMGEQETATGKVFIDTEVPLKGSIIRTFTEIAKNLGADIHFVDYIYDAENNPIEGANGSYDPNTNTFYLNVATGAETNIGYIFMHETTHYLKTYAPEQYQALENLVRERWFAFNPSQMQDAIARKIEAYKRATKGQQVLTEEQALEEIIADASHDFINDPEFARQVAEEDMGLAKAVLDSIRNALRKLRSIFASGGIDDDTHMNSLFRELDILSEAEKLWLDAYKVAVRNSSIAAIDLMDEQMRLSANQAIEDEQNQTIELTETERAELNNNGVDVTEGGSAIKYSLTSWNDTDKDALVRRLVSAGYEEDVARRWVNDVNSVAATIFADMERLNYEADQFQDALKPNSEYYFTLDLSTLCQKRRLYQGTYNAIMHRLVNKALHPEDTVRLRKMMADMGYETPCGICYEESRKKNEGKFAEKWIEKYKAESHDDPYEPTLADVTTTDGRAKLREEHPSVLESYLNYQKGRGSANPKVSFTHTDYRGDILRMTPKQVENVKHIGGLRIQSFSDFETVHVIDMMQAIMDMASIKLTSQAYTKVPAFADIFGGTGIKINLSLIGQVDETGELKFDAKEGIDPDEAFRIRDKYSKHVGTILVGANTESILKAWADPRIDMVIPFHRSGWAKKEFEALGLGDYEDFQEFQSERYLDGSSPKGISLADAKMEAIYSADYWDYSKSGKENAEAYLKLCAEKHYRPVFYNFLHDNGDGTWSLQEDGSTDGYWKSLVDFKMYDNDGAGSPQELVQPNFDMDVAARVMSEYEGNADTLPVAQDVVDKFVDEMTSSKRYSISTEATDSEGNELSEAQIEFFKDSKVRDDDGKLIRMYHGTYEDFTVFEPNEFVEEQNGLSRIKGYFSTSEDYSSVYGDTTPYYLNMQNPLFIPDESKRLNEWKEWFAKQGVNGVTFDSGIERDDVKGYGFEDGTKGYALWELFDAGDYWYGDGNLTEMIEAAGYDGIYWHEGEGWNIGGGRFVEGKPFAYMPFNQNAIKRADNLNPTENPDIRYSIPDENEVKDYIAQKADNIDDIPLSDAVLEQNRQNHMSAAEAFEASVTGSWSRRTLNLEAKEKTPLKNQLMNFMKQVRRGSGTERQYKTETLDETTKSVENMYAYAKANNAQAFAREAWVAAERIVDDIDYNDDLYIKYEGLRDYFAKTNIAIPEDMVYDADFADFARDNYGRMRFFEEGKSIEDVYKHLAKTYPELFTEDIEDPIDMIIQMDYVLSYIEPYKDAYTSEQHAKLVEDIANNLCNIVSEGKEYRATLDELNVKAMKQRHQEAMNKIKLQRDKQAERADKWKERFQNRVQKDVADRKEKSEKKEHRKHFTRIQANYDTLCRWVLNPTKEKNVPEEFRKSLAELLQTLDLQTENSKKLEAKTGHVANKTFKMRELKDQLQDLAERKGDDGTSIFEVDKNTAFLMKSLSNKLDGKSIDELDAVAIRDIDTVFTAIIQNIKRYKKVKTETKMAELSDIGGRGVTFLRDKIKRDGVFKKKGAIQTINATALTPAYLFERLGPLKEMYDVLRHNGFDTYIRNEKMIMDRMGEILGDYYKTNKKGQLLPGSEAEKWRDDRSAQTIELENGKSITMSAAQMMSLYCLTKRGMQAIGHMCVGGVVVTPIQVGSKIQAAKDRIKNKGTEESTEKRVLTINDIRNIISHLTEDQKKVADQLQSLMSNEMAQLGNEAHRELYGYEMFNEDNYFPIKVYGNERSTDINTIGEVVERIKSFGFTEPLTPNANKALEIDDIFSVVADHCNGMNLYNAYLVPITDFMKVLNYTHTFEDGEVLTMKEAIEQAYGKDMLKYILNLMKDINGIKGENRGGLEGIMNKALGTAKRTAVFGNVRVALQQPTAIVRAAAEINPKYIKGAMHLDSAKGFIPTVETKTMQEMWKYCPISQWKAWGYYDTYMGRDIEDVMMNKWSVGDKLLSGYYGQLDNATWSMIWQAVKAEQRDAHPNMDHNSEEFLQLCGRRASEVFDKTQVVDSTFHRSDAMRNKQIAVKLFTAFMAEPTLTMNVFRAGLFNANEASKAGNKGEAAKIRARAISVIVVQAMVVSAAQAFADAWRGKDPGLPWDDDDDEEKIGYWWRWIHNFVYNCFDQAHLENNMYLVKDVTPYINYMISQAADYYNVNPTVRAIMGWDQDYLYSQNNLVFAGLENTANGVAQLFKKLEKGDEYVDYKTKEPKKWYDIIQKIASGIGTFTGIPVGTLMRDFKPFIEKFLPAVYAADTGLMDSIADKMGYKPIGSNDKETSKAKGASTEDESKTETTLDVDQKEYADKAKSIAEKTADLTGEARDKKVWSYVTTYLKSQNGDKPLNEFIQEGDYDTVDEYRKMYIAAGGNLDYFNERVFATSKSAMKKTIVYDPTPEQNTAQENIKMYLLTHGMSESEMSQMAYESFTARDMKIAFRINDKDAMLETLVPLVRAGLSYDDLQRLWDNRNRVDIMKYKSSNGRYADRLKSTGTFIWPTNGSITSYFGYRNAPTRGASSNHPAIDIGASMGAEVVASDGGVVISTGWNGGYGNSVGIKHDNGMVTYYNHLSAWNVKVGDTVAQGQPIANVGSTGVSTGPHLDFKVLDANGKPVDPLKYLASRS